MFHEEAKLLSGRWRLDKSYLPVLQRTIERLNAMTVSEVIAAKVAYNTAQPAAPTLIGDVALIEISGPITYRSSWLSRYLCWPTIEDLQAQLRAAIADTTVKTILFRWDSPGGVVDMVKEFGDEIYAARSAGKAMISVADLMICSAAYWLGAQTDVIYATDSSQIGSIGVYTMHIDISAALEQDGVKITYIHYGEHKVDGNPYEPLSDDVRATIQEEVDEIGGWFDGAVARGRDVTRKVVSDTFGQGLVFSGPRAIDLGLADKRGTFQQVLGRLSKGRSSAARVALRPRRGAEDDEDPADVVDPNEDGTCPDGYEKDEDGLCYLTASASSPAAVEIAPAQIEADVDAAAAAVQIAERSV
jgi:signal peptide peptidase SppA